MAEGEGPEGEQPNRRSQPLAGWLGREARALLAPSLHGALGKERERAATTTGLPQRVCEHPQAPNLGEAPETGHFLIEYDINYRVHH